jgi:YihY family inner membrane protein
MIAGGIAFNILLYLIPLFLVVLYIVNLFVEPANFQTTLTALLKELLPPTASTETILHEVIIEVNNIIEYSSVFGYIGFAALLWISSTLISSLRTGLNAVFEIPSPRVYFFYRVKDILLTVILTVLILVYSYVVPIVLIAIEILETNINNLSVYIDLALSDLLKIFVPLLSTAMLFYFILRSVPNRKLPRKVRLVATGISVVSIELGRNIFAWYISSVSNYGRFYGTYAIIVSFALWIYYSSLILLLSAELSRYIFNNSEE